MLTPETAWLPYRPSASDRWDVRKAGHLLRRAGFGPTRAELDACVRDGPDAAVTKLLVGGPPGDADETSDFLASEKALPAGSPPARLAAWWLARMLQTAHPLREKLAFFWHNHFATSVTKVRDARLMLGQYRLIHEHALGSYAELLREMSTDPAMLIWLDGRSSTKEKPNENYARELFELFALGVGNYTEADIREAARAFTGYPVAGGAAKFRAAQHDAGRKAVLGRAGDWKPDDVVRICLDQPACARFVAGKLVRFFVTEAETLPAEFVEPLAAAFRDGGYAVAPVVETILRSRMFFSDRAYRTKVKSPVEFALGIVRGLGGNAGPLPLAGALESLGQNLFAPPSVKGWDGGAAWLSPQTLLARQNLALALCGTEDVRFGSRCDPSEYLMRRGETADDAAVESLLALFLPGDAPEGLRDRLRRYLAEARGGRVPPFWSADDAARHRLRAAAHMVLTTPEYQLN